MGVSELVNLSPVATADGSMLIGSQHTSVFLLDARTGQLLRCACRSAVLVHWLQHAACPCARPHASCTDKVALHADPLVCRTIYDFDGELGQLDASTLGAPAGAVQRLALALCCSACSQWQQPSMPLLRTAALPTAAACRR